MSTPSPTITQRRCWARRTGAGRAARTHLHRLAVPRRCSPTLARPLCQARGGHAAQLLTIEAIPRASAPAAAATWHGSTHALLPSRTARARRGWLEDPERCQLGRALVRDRVAVRLGEAVLARLGERQWPRGVGRLAHFALLRGGGVDERALRARPPVAPVAGGGGGGACAVSVALAHGCVRSGACKGGERESRRRMVTARTGAGGRGRWASLGWGQTERMGRGRGNNARTCWQQAPPAPPRALPACSPLRVVSRSIRPHHPIAALAPPSAEASASARTRPWHAVRSPWPSLATEYAPGPLGDGAARG